MTNANQTNDRLQCFSLTGIDGKTTGATLIFTPTSRFTPLIVSTELTTVSGFVSVSSLSFGSNGASYNNILAISAMTLVVAANNVLNFPVSALATSVAAGTGIFVNVTSAAVATTYTIKVSITGFYD